MFSFLSYKEGAEGKVAGEKVHNHRSPPGPLSNSRRSPSRTPLFERGGIFQRRTIHPLGPPPFIKAGEAVAFPSPLPLPEPIIDAIGFGLRLFRSMNSGGMVPLISALSSYTNILMSKSCRSARWFRMS